MQVWEQRLKQLYDDVANYADDWTECLEMVEDAPADQSLVEYLELLSPRLKRMNRQLNRVSCITTERCWEIANYSYKLYWYFKQKYPNDIVVTPYTLHIADEALTVADREQLHRQL